MKKLLFLPVLSIILVNSCVTTYQLPDSAINEFIKGDHDDRCYLQQGNEGETTKICFIEPENLRILILPMKDGFMNAVHPGQALLKMQDNFYKVYRIPFATDVPDDEFCGTLEIPDKNTLTLKGDCDQLGIFKKITPGHRKSAK